VTAALMVSCPYMVLIFIECLQKDIETQACNKTDGVNQPLWLPAAGCANELPVSEDLYLIVSIFLTWHNL